MAKSPGKNVDHTTTRELIAQAEADGVLPLQVMFDNMRFYTRQADKVLRELLDSGGNMPGRKFNAADNNDQPIGTEDDPAGEEEGAYRGIIEGFKRVLELRRWRAMKRRGHHHMCTRVKAMPATTSRRTILSPSPSASPTTHAATISRPPPATFPDRKPPPSRSRGPHSKTIVYPIAGSLRALIRST